MVKVSVIIAAYNAEPFIQRAIQSVVDQDLAQKEFEILVVDDGSTDDTVQRLKTFGEKVRLFEEKHRGLADACNTALQKAKGTYFLRLDADDTLAPQALSSLLSAIEKDAESGLVYADWTEIDPKGSKKRITVQPFNLFKLLACGILFRTSVARDIKGYSEMLFEEYDFMLRYIQRMPATQYVPQALYNYYLHGDNMTQKSGYWEKGWKEFITKWGETELSKWNYREAYHP